MIQQQVNLGKLIPKTPVDPDTDPESDEGKISTLVNNAINNISSDKFNLELDDNLITMDYSDGSVELTDISGTGAMVQLINIVNDEDVDSVIFEHNGETISIDSTDTTSSAKSKILPLIAAASADGTLGGLEGEHFTITVNMTDGYNKEYNFDIM